MTFNITFYNASSEHVYIEQEIEFRGDTYLVEAENAYWTEAPDPEEGFWHATNDNPLFEFKIYRYSELVQDWEGPINDDLTEDENFALQQDIYEMWGAQAETAHENRSER